MIEVGRYNTLKVLRITGIGAFLEDGDKGILLPKRFMPRNLKAGDNIEVFIYHDSENRMIATTQRPLGIVGDIVRLKVVSTTRMGAFMNMGIMKDIFVPRSQMIQVMREVGEYLVKIYLDEQTNRIAATQYFEKDFSNDNITLQPGEEVQMTALRRTNIGYMMVINNLHTGVLHFSDIFQPIHEGDSMKGFVKKIYPDNKIDLVTSEKGYGRISKEAEKIEKLLIDNNGYLPYNDNSEPEDIYNFFKMSKKAFKMAVGNLYKNRRITMEKTGIRLNEN